MTLLSVVIPSLGRASLSVTLESIRAQAVPAEIIVVLDTFKPDASAITTAAQVAGFYGARVLELDAGRHDAGSPQLELGYGAATGRWIVNLGDDDIYEPEAFAVICDGIDEQKTPHPLLFRVTLHPAPHRANTSPVVLWDRLELTEGHVTGQGFVCPNRPDQFGYWTNDWTFIVTTVAKYGGWVDWREEVICACY